THIKLAAVLEFIHSATLLHDDVVDQSQKRRGRYTANLIWGNAAPILVGDFLYSRAFQMIVSIKSMKILEILALATNVIAEGEVLQLAKRHDPHIDEETYLQIIYAKTAKLFEVAAQLGALKQKNNFFEPCLQEYGKHVGIAFQLIDDVLDYSASPEIMGKNVGDDLAEGKTTLPLLHALQKGTDAQKTFIQNTIRQGSCTILQLFKKLL
ncbi:MAG TPA: polyprenyl synthetase family protein, partial [Gammaproteobacteria bacterium]|nr:polyprenyl synthetase family protein [Gammaproteobacteria bacterium]